MVSKDESRNSVRGLVRRVRVVQLEDLYGVLATRSRITVFRRLREVGYLSSFTHCGR